ncbi:hypothetical protein BDC45DRAFT_517530 [Circinella umbellata]|nr:hypothetical protein BDC45DRAFT_517530 [Circinella umbellata]
MSDAAGHRVLRSVDENQHGDGHPTASNTRTSLHTITNSNENSNENNNHNDDGWDSDDCTTNAETFRIKIPSTKDRCMVGEVDMSLSFFAFQLVCQNNFKELNLESNVHHILAMSSVLLLQKKKFHPDLKAIVGDDTLNTFYDNLQQEYETGRYCKSKFDPVLEQQIRQIIKVEKKIIIADG